ncbi:hypothetical protein MMC07_002509 [Pseudocyphellaria aurata]|nr:hypothetical protein [Pseudocyphellaria aurata]
MVVLETLLLCRPLAYNWNPTIPGGHCADRPKAWLSSGIINLLLDICIIYMPLPLLWKLQMPTTKKLGITAMFGVGAVILVFTIFRIVSIRRLDPKDLTYGFVWVIYWGVLEPLLGIVNACAPTVRPAIEKMLEYKFPDWSKLGPGSRKTKIYMSNSSAAHSAGPNDKAFNRLYEHEYPSDKAFNRLYECELGDIDVEGQVAVPETTYSPDPSARNSPTSPSENAIKVTRGWNVG